LALITQCAGTLKELECPWLRKGEADNDKWNEALARCTRLESLTDASTFAPAAWLGLSQLHTLLGVNLAAVSVAAITAALPRLHTFGAAHYATSGPTAAALAGFFGTLLPRLRVFRFFGDREWPVDDATPAAPVQALLPLLEELVWEPSRIVAGFAGAQPVVLCAPYQVVAEYVATRRPLSHVRDLRFHGRTPQASDVAAVLRAAPELRQLHGGEVRDYVTWHNDPAFAGLVHRKLRTLRFQSYCRGRLDEKLFDAEYDELRAHHFPRLRTFTLD
jgi:hypothetical protein